MVSIIASPSVEKRFVRPERDLLGNNSILTSILVSPHATCMRLLCAACCTECSVRYSESLALFRCIPPPDRTHVDVVVMRAHAHAVFRLMVLIIIMLMITAAQRCCEPIFTDMWYGRCRHKIRTTAHTVRRNSAFFTTHLRLVVVAFGVVV